MPKRAHTPPPSDDEPKLLAVCHPYPLHANIMLNSEDNVAFARWIACFIDLDKFVSFSYKSKAHGMVIVHVKKSFTNFSAVLGEHKWSDFLRNPTDEEKGRVSKVFHCFYPFDRIAQKDGWNSINVDPLWFNDWNPNTIFTRPYPRVIWCDVPRQDMTNKPLCRPIPLDSIPQPQPATAPVAVVGSPAWASAKANAIAAGSSSSSVHAPVATHPRGAWNRGLGRGRGAHAPTILTIPAPTTTTASKNPPAGAWSKGPPSSGPASGSSSTTSGSWPAWSPRQGSDISSPPSSIASAHRTEASVAPNASKGKEKAPSNPTESQNPAPTNQVISWADDEEEAAEEENEWWAAVDTSQFPHFFAPPEPETQDLIDAMENLATDHSVDPQHTYATDWEVRSSGDTDGNNLWVGSSAYGSSAVPVTDSLWDDDPPETKMAGEKFDCKIHQPRCSSGICRERYEQRRAANRRQREQEFEAAKNSKVASRGKKGNGRERKVDASRSVYGSSSVSSGPLYSRAASVAGSSSGSSKSGRGTERPGSRTSNWRRDDRTEPGSPSD